MEVGLVYDHRMCLHVNSEEPSHVEQPDRIKSIYDKLKSEGIVTRCKEIAAREATDPELAGVHTEKHIKNIRRMSSEIVRSFDTKASHELADIFFCRQTLASARLAAGSVVELSQLVAKGEIRAGAAVVRPPGHHAETDTAMGFCYFNNVAVAAHALVHGDPALAQKVLIVDWDIHHGNGTQKIFWEDPNVLFFSIHKNDLYPGGPRQADDDYERIGKARGTGFNINIPWPSGEFGDSDYLTVFDEILIPVAREFSPDLVLVSAGFDAAKGDPVGDPDSVGTAKVTTAGFSQMTKKLMGLANGRLVLALEGGYNLQERSPDNLPNSFLACMKALLNDAPEETAEHKLSSETPGLVARIKRHLEVHWPVLSTGNKASEAGSSAAAKDMEVLLNTDLPEEIEDQEPLSPAPGLKRKARRKVTRRQLQLENQQGPSTRSRTSRETSAPAKDDEEVSAKEENADFLQGRSDLPQDDNDKFNSSSFN